MLHPNLFFSCWNTAYCDFPCQQVHWPKHMNTCANVNQHTETEATEVDVCSSPIESAKTTTSQKSIPVSRFCT
jgi:hypothetical protein